MKLIPLTSSKKQPLIDEPEIFYINPNYIAIVQERSGHTQVSMYNEFLGSLRVSETAQQINDLIKSEETI